MFSSCYHLCTVLDIHNWSCFFIKNSCSPTAPQLLAWGITEQTWTHHFYSLLPKGSFTLVFSWIDFTWKDIFKFQGFPAQCWPRRWRSGPRIRHKRPLSSAPLFLIIHSLHSLTSGSSPWVTNRFIAHKIQLGFFWGGGEEKITRCYPECVFIVEANYTRFAFIHALICREKRTVKYNGSYNMNGKLISLLC